MIAEESLVKWLEMELAALTTGEPLAKLELYHAVEGEGPEKCQGFIIQEGANVQELAQMVWDVAEHDAGTRSAGMQQRYVIWAFHGESLEPQSQHPFTIRGRSQGSLMAVGLDSEPATDRGERSQQMRQLENQHRMIMLMSDAVAGRLISELDRERARREKAEDKVVAAIQREQDMLDRKQERELALAKSEARARHVDTAIGTFLGMVPLIGAKLLSGDKPIGGTAHGAARDQAVGRILKGLSTEEGMAIMNGLQGQNKLAFIELYKSYKEDDEKDQAKKSPVLRDKPHLKPVSK